VENDADGDFLVSEEALVNGAVGRPWAVCWACPGRRPTEAAGAVDSRPDLLQRREALAFRTAFDFGSPSLVFGSGFRRVVVEAVSQARRDQSFRFRYASRNGKGPVFREGRPRLVDTNVIVFASMVQPTLPTANPLVEPNATTASLSFS